MSILIKGMEMPKDEPLLVKINPDGTVSTTARNNYKKYNAVELPPHGRLIDADFVIAEYDKIHVGKPGGARLLIANAPTVIEAEEVSE